MTYTVYLGCPKPVVVRAPARMADHAIQLAIAKSNAHRQRYGFQYPFKTAKAYNAWLNPAPAHKPTTL